MARKIPCVLWIGGFIAVSLLTAIDCNPARAALGADVSQGEGSAKTAEFYSGIECLQRAGQMLDRPVDMIELLSSPHSELPQDDPSRDLAGMATEQKLNALAIVRLSNDQIEQSPYPLLIHVEGGRYSIKPDYYVLCQGVRNGKADVFSPSLGDLTIPVSELEEDRRAEVIVLSNEPLPANVAFTRRAIPIARYGFMFGVVLSLTAIAVARRGQPTRSNFPGVMRRTGSSLVQFVGLTVVAVVLAFACRVTSGQSILPSPPAAGGTPIDFLLPQSADNVNLVAKPLEISIETARRLITTDTLFVDARDAGEYNAGHIKGAILFPAADIGRWHLHMAGIDPHRRLVVYCAEASCGKGEYVATFLLENGFTDVCLYRDGWAKWTGPKESK